jgi:hypothetical protein
MHYKHAGTHGVETRRLGRRAVSLSHGTDSGRTPIRERARLWAALQGRAGRGKAMNLRVNVDLLTSEVFPAQHDGGAVG